MAENNSIAKIVEKVVGQALEDHLPQLRAEIAHKVLEQVQPLAGKSGRTRNSAEDLLKAVSLIHAGGNQKEILRALLDGTATYCGRAALFVMKAGSAVGWQGRAFDNSEDIKDFALDVNAAISSRVLETRTAIVSQVSEMDPKFVSQFGAPAEDHVALFPLHLKDKIAALVYADGGTNGAGKMDTAALELLVAATSAWLEVASLRKQSAKEGTSEPAEAAPAPVQTVSSYSDPFAAHAPRHAAPAPIEVAEPMVATASASGAAAAAAPAREAPPQMSPQDAEIHRKAQRFARLLMDEIKLYNQAKVAEGRKNRDLYDRLKEDIEKSRATYMKRYGNTVAASGDYFVAELVRSLAEDDMALLGPNFRR
jgi:hypothetical protein